MRNEAGKIEKKWQKIWERSKIYQASDQVKGKKNFYHLVMFPYPSGNLHIGHWHNFGPADVYARFKRMQGYNVLSPIGFDAFGLPAENAAIKHNLHPKTWTENNVKRMRKQLKSIGACYDWSREITTCQPGYYQWTQWMFLQLYKAGLAYRAKVPANWCPSCKTILANEQVVEGRCERCDSEVLQKDIEQWLFHITAFTDELLKGLEKLDWPEMTKAMQRNWIGRSTGLELKFKIQNAKVKSTTQKSKVIKVFTTRIDTLFGATYLVLAPEHPIIETLKGDIANYKEVEDYIEKARKKTERERLSEVKEKTGVEIKGIKAINPANNKEIPIWVADYALISYGTGAIMAVPAHDQRDMDFAKNNNLPIICVVRPRSISDFGAKKTTSDTGEIKISGKVLTFWPAKEKIDDAFTKEVEAITSGKRYYTGEGELINSEQFNGLHSEAAKEKITEWLRKQGLAQKIVNYKLRDWVISRQRYWGTPIPMVFCQKCGWRPVKEKDLPILLPSLKDFRPGSEGKSPLARSERFVKTKCPTCGQNGQRETDTMDTFVCSSWYFLRYVDPKNKKRFAAKEKVKTWLPVNMYIGGAEHTVLHLLYARFLIKALKKLGWLDFSEPFLRLRHQGIILGPDGKKMSKSKGNVVDPDEQVAKYGADAVRMYLCFMGPYDQGGPWQMKGMVGLERFLQRVWIVAHKIIEDKKTLTDISGSSKLIHKTIKKVSEDIEKMKFNTAISQLMVQFNGIDGNPDWRDKLNSNGDWEGRKQIDYLAFKNFLILLAPFAPHLSEELWQRTKEQNFNIEDSIHSQPWPEYDPKLVKEELITLIIQVNGRVRDKMMTKPEITKDEAEKLALAGEKIQKYIKGKTLKNIIFVPRKLINFVI